MYLIFDCAVDCSISSWNIKKPAERQTSQKRSFKVNWDEKWEGWEKKIMQKIWWLGGWTHLLVNSEWSYTTVLWKSKELIPFYIEFFLPFLQNMVYLRDALCVSDFFSFGLAEQTTREWKEIVFLLNDTECLAITRYQIHWASREKKIETKYWFWFTGEVTR